MPGCELWYHLMLREGGGSGPGKENVMAGGNGGMLERKGDEGTEWQCLYEGQEGL